MKTLKKIKFRWSNNESLESRELCTHISNLKLRPTRFQEITIIVFSIYLTTVFCLSIRNKTCQIICVHRRCWLTSYTKNNQDDTNTSLATNTSKTGKREKEKTKEKFKIITRMTAILIKIRPIVLFKKFSRRKYPQWWLEANDVTRTFKNCLKNPKKSREKKLVFLYFVFVFVFLLFLNYYRNKDLTNYSSLTFSYIQKLDKWLVDYWFP